MRPYLRLFLRPMLVISISILALIEVIFLAEEFTGLMEQVVSRGGSAFDLLRLLIWQSPEILDLALPAALLVGVYSAVGRARRDGELVVLAATGAPVRGLVAGALLVGLAGGVLSFAISGLAAPAANYAQRVALYQMTVEHVANQIAAPGESGTTFSTNDVDFVATGATDHPPALLVRREVDAQPWRYAFAGDWEVTGPDEEGRGTFRLGQVSAFGDLPALNGETAEAGLNRLAAGKVSVGFDMDDILPALDRSRRENERPVIPFFRAYVAGDEVGMATDPRRVAMIWARALLVPGAVLIALMAVWGGTIHYVRSAALPLALVTLVLCDLVVRAWLGGLVAGPGLVLACIAVAAGLLGLPLLALARAGEALIRPGRG
ncbi:MAG: LptF/LptG family permease [Pseudooceanicola sp.]